MGIARSALQVLLQEAQRRPFTGCDLLTLGKMDIWFPEQVLVDMAEDHGVALTPTPNPVRPVKQDFRDKGCISDHHLFHALGFTSLRVIDYSDYEGAEIVHDLNEAHVPEALKGQFDVIIDGGTIEHVFHLPHVMQAIFQMLRVGGRIIHLSPSSNHMDHGFYMFSPTFFWDFYHCNGFDINTCQLAEFIGPRHDVDLWKLMDYRPGCLDHLSLGGLGHFTYMVVFVGTKTPEATGDRVPQQGMYLRQHWNHGTRSLDDHIGDIDGCLQRKDFGAAERISSDLVAVHGDQSRAWLVRARTLVFLGRPEEAVGAIGNSLERELSPDALVLLVELYRAMNLTQEAAQAAAFLAKTFPGFAVPQGSPRP